MLKLRVECAKAGIDFAALMPTMNLEEMKSTDP